MAIKGVLRQFKKVYKTKEIPIQGRKESWEFLTSKCDNFSQGGASRGFSSIFGVFHEFKCSFLLIIF